VKWLFSGQVPGPVTAGRTIILPFSLLAEPSQDVLPTGIGHQMVHIARYDFACNLLYELNLPVSSHPPAWWIHRGIEQMRETACDEMVTERLIDAGVYARANVSIATRMTALPRPGYTLGVFDGGVIEERIRRPVGRPAVNLKRARLRLVSGLSALAACGVIASSLALIARAQGPAQALLKQGAAAYNRGDDKDAAEQFESAVKPANAKAKLLLANARLRQTFLVARTRPARARLQYLHVLTLDRGNQQALAGMMIAPRLTPVRR
jgi:hypothetical protein